MVFRIFSADSKSVWKNIDIKKRFSRYRAIIDEKQIARYLIAKTIECNYSNQHSLDKLEKELQDKSAIIDELLERPSNEIEKREIKKKNYLILTAEIASRYLENCIFCERRCEVNRIDGEKGFCLIGKESYVSSGFLHMGEEAPLIPSGTIFFQGCNFGCVFCQNSDISQAWKERRNLEEIARKITEKELAQLADALGKKGARNINYVGGDPIPNIHTILGSLNYQTANICQLWNSNFFLTNKSLSLLIKLMDFWLPDFKYGNNKCAAKYSGVEHYYDILTRNLKRIHDEGSREIIIRHLVMPNHIECCSFPILEFIAEEVPKCVVNIMGQYHPAYHANQYSQINRRPTSEEMNKVKEYADQLDILYRPVS
ncbi:MAG: radical SAM protein [Promethearchaeia archaeon]